VRKRAQGLKPRSLLAGYGTAESRALTQNELIPNDLHIDSQNQHDWYWRAEKFSKPYNIRIP
jgi:hypothetical protein